MVTLTTIFSVIGGSALTSLIFNYLFINRQNHKHTKEIESLKANSQIELKKVEQLLQIELKKNEQVIQLEVENFKNYMKQMQDEFLERKKLYDILYEKGYRLKKAVDNVILNNSKQTVESLETIITEFRDILFPARKFLEQDGKFKVVHDFIRQAEHLLRLAKDNQSSEKIIEVGQELENLLSELYKIENVPIKNIAQQGFGKMGA
jgi:hypothetical protein